jgi:hypothetical protein
MVSQGRLRTFAGNSRPKLKHGQSQRKLDSATHDWARNSKQTYRLLERKINKTNGVMINGELKKNQE